LYFQSPHSVLADYTKAMPISHRRCDVSEL